MTEKMISEKKDVLRKTLARILSSCDIVSMGMRYCIKIKNEDPDRYTTEELERMAISHTCSLLDRCIPMSFVENFPVVTDNPEVVTVGIVGYSLYVSWNMLNEVKVMYTASCYHNEVYEKEVELILNKLYETGKL